MSKYKQVINNIFQLIWHVYHDVQWHIMEYAIEAVALHNAILTEKCCLLLMYKVIERKTFDQ